MYLVEMISQVYSQYLIVQKSDPDVPIKLLIFFLKFSQTLSTIVNMETMAKQVRFIGRVQGVGFRYTTQRAASRYALTGYVKNCFDGSVEALLQGTGPNISACIKEIQKTFGGHIRELKANRQPVDPRYHDFRITY